MSTLYFFNVVEKFQNLGGPFTEQGLNVSQEKEKCNGLFEMRHFPLNQCWQTLLGAKPLVDTFTNLCDDGHRQNGDMVNRSCRYKRFKHFFKQALLKPGKKILVN